MTLDGSIFHPREVEESRKESGSSYSGLRARGNSVEICRNAGVAFFFSLTLVV